MVESAGLVLRSLNEFGDQIASKQLVLETCNDARLDNLALDRPSVVTSVSAVVIEAAIAVLTTDNCRARW
jgi:hypothetical protein